MLQYYRQIQVRIFDPHRLPYAVNDYAMTNAVIPLKPLLDRLVRS